MKYKIEVQRYSGCTKRIVVDSFKEGLQVIKELSRDEDVKGVPQMSEYVKGWWEC